MKLDARVGERITALIKKAEAVIQTQRRSQYTSEMFVDADRYAEWRSQALVCIEQVFGHAHTYRRSFADEAKTGDSISRSVRNGLGILRAALEDVEQGHLQEVRQIATAEVFSDFIDQADHLLENGYHIPAASLAGAVLENGLRSLAEKNDIATRPRDDLTALNGKLAAKSVYNRLRQKQVAVWVDVRNAADHGRFDDFTEADVADLVKGVQTFLAEYL